MTFPPVVIHPDDTLEEALAIMVGHNFDHLPVVPEGNTGYAGRFSHPL